MNNAVNYEYWWWFAVVNPHWISFNFFFFFQGKDTGYVSTLLSNATEFVRAHAISALDQFATDGILPLPRLYASRSSAQLPAVLQPPISLMLHLNVTRVLAVGTDTAAPTEVSGKAESPQNKIVAQKSTLDLRLSCVKQYCRFCNCALCRSITYWLVDCFSRFAKLDWT